MASSSTSSVKKSFKYDVFLSFRGEDTRNKFVGHLYHALHQKSIHTYKDDERIKKGEKISDELVKSIQDSRFHVIVFSKNYASSSWWCLDELVQIIECQKTAEQTAYPVFYDMEPSEVRKQSGEFGKVFAKHDKEDDVGKWREALEEAAGLAGWELKNTLDGNEAKLIQKIVEEISLELRSNNSSIDEKLVGMEDRIWDVVSSLKIGLHDVRMIGIKGMGGGGKTTLAKAVFDHISFQFEGSSFVENVRENSNPNFSGLKKLQKQVLKDVLNDPNIKISNVHDGKNTMKKMMCCKKVLVILDDVDHVDQLQALAGELNWFKDGSRIIITTRDEQVLVAHRVNLIHDVNLLSHQEAISLFSMYAFGRESPIQGYKELSRQVVGYAAGLPLTITVLGSFLCGKNELEWKDAIERLETIPLKETLEKLELSYISLEEDYKEIFLDVACIMKGWGKDEAIRVLESCGFHARNGLRVLEQRSLITISKYSHVESLGMHDHIEEMGKNIVRRLHPNEPNRHSRLWIMKEIEDILANNQGTEVTKCIQLDASETLNPKIVRKGLRNMKNLRYLHMGLKGYDSNWKFDEVSQYFPNALRYLSWDHYPFKSLPETFEANNLVAVRLYGNRFVQLWKGGERKVLKKLRFLTLGHSKLKSLDLGLIPILENLSLEGCFDLVQLHIPVECHPKLRSLDIDSSKLRTLHLRGTSYLATLRLVRCDDLVELHIPADCLKLTTLRLSCCKLRTLSLGWTPNLKTLNLGGCNNLVELHMLVECHLKLGSFSVNHPQSRNLGFHRTTNLKALDDCNAYNFNLECFNIPVGCCIKLISLDLNHSELMTAELQETLVLETLCIVGGVDHLVEIHTLVECRLKITSLDLSYSKLRTLDLQGTPNLETLSLVECVDLVELHIPIECRLKLISLNLSSSMLRTLDLRGAANLEKVHLGKCVDLEELHIPIECLKLRSLDLGSSKLRILDLRGAPNLETLSVRRCYDLVELSMPHECLQLKSLNLSCPQLRSFNLDDLVLPELENLDIKRNSELKTIDLGRTPNLKSLHLKTCSNLVELRTPIGGLKKLIHLELQGYLGAYFEILNKGGLPELKLFVKSVDICPLHPDNKSPKFNFECSYQEDLPSSIGNIEKLISVGNFSCACTGLKKLYESICDLQHLANLTLHGNIPEAPKYLDRLQCLEKITLWSTSIKHLPDSILSLKHLKTLRLIDCKLLEKLPEDLCRLECLEMLVLTECIVLRDIPNNICRMKRLRYFYLGYCSRVQELPKELGRLECLEELDVRGTCIKHLPQSVLLLKKGLRIVGSIELLELYKSLPTIKTAHFGTHGYIDL